MFFFGGHYVWVGEQRLNSYTESSGGGMTGGYRAMSIERYDERYALCTFERAEWHSQDPQVTEYLLDVGVLDAIRDVFLKKKMNFWNNKKFTNMFIADGESHSYHFMFDTAWVSFSSQHYPERYVRKLALLDEAIDPYQKDRKPLPGLVLPETAQEEERYTPASRGASACMSAGTAKITCTTRWSTPRRRRSAIHSGRPSGICRMDPA